MGRKMSAGFATFELLKGAVRSFTHDKRGSIAIMFALMLTASVALAGGAIDFGRWLSAKSKTHNAMDAAVLAGGRVLQLAGKTNADAVAAAQEYYNLNNPGVLSNDSTSFSIANNEITGTSASSVETVFLKVVGIDSLAVNLTSKAVLAAGGNSGAHVEIAMMLDTTGSMGGSKMTDLKAAAKDLVDIVVWDDQSNYTSRIGLAPFAEYVNVGAQYFQQVAGPNANIMTSTVTRCSGWGWGRSCSTTTTTKDILDDGDKYTCIKERNTTSRYTDDAPGSGNYFKFYGDTSTDRLYIVNYEYACRPNTVITPMTSDKTTLKNNIDAFPTSGGTAGHLGTQWAWYLLSPNWNSVWPTASEAYPYTMLSQQNSDGSPKLYKIAILMTDGSYNTYFSGYNSTTQAREICTEMKNTGITVYTVGFQISQNSSPDITMQQCATSAQHYYNASNGEALKSAFRDIALKIADLRISE